MQARMAQRDGKAIMARAARRGRPQWRPTPLAQAVAALLIAGSWSSTAQAQARAFSPGWFADKNAVQSTAQRTGRMPDGSLAPDNRALVAGLVGALAALGRRPATADEIRGQYI